MEYISRYSQDDLRYGQIWQHRKGKEVLVLCVTKSPLQAKDEDHYHHKNGKTLYHICSDINKGDLIVNYMHDGQMYLRTVDNFVAPIEDDAQAHRFELIHEAGQIDIFQFMTGAIIEQSDIQTPEKCSVESDRNTGEL